MGCGGSKQSATAGRKGRKGKKKVQAKRSAPSLHLQLQKTKSQAGEVPPRPARELDDQTLREHYTITEDLGSGCFATVMKAQCKEAGTPVSVKMIDKNLIDNVAEVENEIAALRAVSHHDAVVTLITTLEGAQAHFLVSEVLHGGDLFDRLYGPNYDGCFCESDASRNAQQLFSALAHIHKLGWIHRDLKPENLLYATEDTALYDLRVIDFGYAVYLAPGELIKDGTLLGTPHYLAPEMAEKKPYHHGVDVWAAGVIVYQMVFGVLPFDDDELTDEYADAEKLWENNTVLLSKIAEGKIDYDAKHWRGKSSLLKSFMRQVLCKDINKRLTAEKALQHPWITQSQESGPTEFTTQQS